jgi:hypothetical protein
MSLAAMEGLDIGVGGGLRSANTGRGVREAKAAVKEYSTLRLRSEFTA